MVGMMVTDYYVGHDALRRRGILQCKTPVTRGVVTNWDDLEKIWHHTFYNELNLQPQDHPVLVTEAPLTPKADREKMLLILFETFEVPSAYLCNAQVLALYAAGRTRGMVVDFGATQIAAVPIYDGVSIADCVACLDFGGAELTGYLMQLLTDRGYYFQSSQDRIIADDIKEKLGYVALDYDVELATTEQEASYDLPSEAVGSERFRCCEPLFLPSLMGLECPGVQTKIAEAASKCDVDVQEELFASVLLAGGSSLFPGLSERLAKELSALTNYPVNVIAPRCHVSSRTGVQYSTWVGGSTLAALPLFRSTWLSRDEYDEEGPQLVHQRCVS